MIQWYAKDAQHHSDADVLRRIRQLGAERALVIALRLASDLADDCLPKWAREMAGRLPARTPLLARIVYPDLSRGRPPSPLGESTRAFLFTVRPGLDFRVLRVLEAVLPTPRVPGIVTEPRRFGQSLRRGLLMAANLSSLAQMKLSRFRNGVRHARHD